VNLRKIARQRQPVTRKSGLVEDLMANGGWGRCGGKRL